MNEILYKHELVVKRTTWDCISLTLSFRYFFTIISMMSQGNVLFHFDCLYMLSSIITYSKKNLLFGEDERRYSFY